MSHSIRAYLRGISGDDPAGPADTELLARFATARDESSFELLVWRHAALVQYVCRQVLGDHHAAEDAAQATFLILARKAHAFSGQRPVVGWLYTIARRVAQRLARDRKRPMLASEALELVAAPEREPSAGSDEMEALGVEVSRLPERYRIPILLCFYEGLTHAEAARRTGWAIGTVAGRLARAKELLARRLTRRGIGVVAVALGLPGGAFVGPTARAAAAFATRRTVVPLVHPSVTTLAEGVLFAMNAIPLKLAATAAILCLVGTSLWAFTAATDPPAANPPLETAVAQVPVKGRPTLPPALPVPAAPVEVGRAADRVQIEIAQNHLKQIMLAMHSFIDVNGCLPQDIVGKNGKPLLSWRVAILPFIEQDRLYKAFKLDEPWDSPHNRALLAKMPETYRLVFQPKDDTKTYFQVFAGPGTPFEPGKKVKFTDITDGTSQTLGAVAIGPPVEWTKPEDISYEPKKPLPQLDLPYKNVFLAAFMDGSVHAFKPTLKPDVLRLLVECADGMPVPDLQEWAAPALAAPPESIDRLILQVRENERLLATIRDQLLEQEKLLKAIAANPKATVKLQVPHEDMNRGLKELLDQLKRDTEDLRRQVEAAKGK